MIEHGDGYGGELQSLLNEINTNPTARASLRLGLLGTAKKQECLPLQPADFLANETGKEMVNFIVPGTDTRALRTSARLLLDGIEEYCGYNTKENLTPADLAPFPWA